MKRKTLPVVVALTVIVICILSLVSFNSISGRLSVNQVCDPSKVGLSQDAPARQVAIFDKECAASLISPECNPATVGLDADAPAELVGVFDFNCASTFPNVRTGMQADYALSLGYPSLFLGGKEDEEIVDLLIDGIISGGRDFIYNDPDLLRELEKRSSNPLIAEIAEYVRAVWEPDAVFAKRNPSGLFLTSLPLWNEKTNATNLANWCLNNECNLTEANCSENLIGLKEKLEIARGDKSFEDVYNMCPFNRSWLQALRRAGLVDTSCSVHYQADILTKMPEKLGEACYSVNPVLLNYGSVRDRIGFLRFSFNAGKDLESIEGLEEFDFGDSDFFESYSIGIGGYLTKIRADAKL